LEPGFSGGHDGGAWGYEKSGGDGLGGI
jgi:hypothetical protein